MSIVNDEQNQIRFEDMSPDNYLWLHRQQDGDFVLTIVERDEDGYHRVHGVKAVATCEFCTPASGGGQSPKTWQALQQLWEAMQEDNRENPQSRNVQSIAPLDKLSDLGL